MITEVADKVFSNAKYGTHHPVNREGFAIAEFANNIRVDNRRCGCPRFTSCNHPTIEKVNILKDGL